MSYVANIVGEELLVQIGDGAVDEAFAHDCLINSERSVEGSSDVVTSVVPRCDDPSAPGKTVRRVRSTDTRVTFSGMLHATSALVWMQWQRAGTPKNIRVKQDVTGAAGGWLLAGSFLLENFSVSGTPHEEQSCTGTLVQADGTTLTANA